MQAVYNIAEICAQHGITDVVLSPGSRCAPLTIAFARHPELHVRTVPDERAAAFIGLGLAQAQRRAVALVCTSGTAALNYAPAVAEAFFQQIPLIIFTADRPPEWIDQLDGQTIRQTDIYGNHVKGAATFPADTTHHDAKWHSARIVSEAINLAQQFPAGPVQVNIPLREPFYPKSGEAFHFEEVKVIREQPGAPSLPTTELAALRQELGQTSRALVVTGQHHHDAALLTALRHFGSDYQVPVVGDVIANVYLSAAPEAKTPFAPIGRQDVFLAVPDKDQKAALRPELLITFGQSLISKALKLYLREYAPKQHWHIQAAGPVADTFKSLTRIIRMEPAAFFEAMLAEPAAREPRVVVANPAVRSAQQRTVPIPRVLLTPPDATAHEGAPAYLASWQRAESWADDFLATFFNASTQPFNEFSAFHLALQFVPGRTAIHLANSMAVRYANILGLANKPDTEVFANRGTSGIDGCNSTAVGSALAQPERPVVLFTGDVAFFYDRNGFWHNYPTPNLRVVLFNNHGGGIFRIIDGPRQQPELEEFFETRQPLTAENTARDFGLRYFAVSSFEELESALPVFFAAEGGAALLEITTDSPTNAEFFEEYRRAVKAAVV
ncbi:2-succinyl-5-enolpyruvyl-6-hydroxy-3-cyclohexene-1-carboxylic-acid synthase [Hymenobacter crusticola]|nr:2-succinyl-5-enolpyruvyl-6-hydroxy-3-cyclohexene-1-carboxylic-acid synthase [Hymenobacter crusticola]